MHCDGILSLMNTEERMDYARKYFDGTGHISCFYLMRKLKITWKEGCRLIKPLSIGCDIVIQYDGQITRLVKKYDISYLIARLD